MKSWTNTVLALALLSTLSLAGCGTNEKTSENENQASSNTVETKEHKDAAKQAVQSNESNQESENQNTASSENKQSEQESAKANDSSNNQTEKKASTNDSVQPKDSSQSKDSTQSGTVRPFEKKIQYSIGGQNKTDTAVLEESDNQGFSMYVLPHYELTAEEPYKDVVYFKDKDQLFMRIELMQKTQNWDTFKQSAFDQLKAINDEVKTISPPNTSTFKNATAYRTSTQDAVVTAYVIPSSTQPIKITIYDDKDSSHSDAFLKMADTIQVK